MRILVCGDRNWTNHELILNKLKEVAGKENEIILIHGCCQGADEISEKVLWYAKRICGICVDSTCYFNVVRFPADWDKYGKAAGLIRNQQMIDEGKPDIVLAFHNNIAKSKGTMDMIKRANAAGVEVRIYADEKK